MPEMTVPGKENVKITQPTADSADKGTVKPEVMPGINIKQVFLAVNVTMPGRSLPVWRVGVDGNARLWDVVRGWAREALQKDFLVLPDGAQVTGRFGGPALDLNAKLHAIKPHLPISGGRPTVNVKWPAEAVSAPAPGKVQPKPSPKAKAEVKKVAVVPKFARAAKVKPVKQDKMKKVKKEKTVKEKKVKEKKIKDKTVKEKKVKELAKAAQKTDAGLEKVTTEGDAKDVSSSDSESDSESSSNSSDSSMPDYMKKVLERDDDFGSPVKASPAKKR